MKAYIQQPGPNAKTYHISENGFLGDKVSVPECYVMAESFLQAAEILSEYLKTKVLTENITLVTPVDRIAFD